MTVVNIAITQEHNITVMYVHMQVVGVVNITTLTNRQYAVILDPVDSKGKPQMGRRKLVKGELSFFLMPGERLERGIQNMYVLGENEGLILKATESFSDGVSKVSLVAICTCCVYVTTIAGVRSFTDTK